MDWKTWRRPTLPCLEAQYHGRWGFSRPSSGWDRVRAPRQSHQVVQSILLIVSRGAPGVTGRAGSFRWIAVLAGCVCCVVSGPGIGDPGFLKMISMHGAVSSLAFRPVARSVLISSRSGD